MKQIIVFSALIFLTLVVCVRAFADCHPSFPCSMLTTQETCEFEYGCVWDGSCTGTMICANYDNQEDCELNAPVFCYWGALTCFGTVTNCTEIGMNWCYDAPLCCSIYNCGFDEGTSTCSGLTSVSCDNAWCDLSFSECSTSSPLSGPSGGFLASGSFIGLFLLIMAFAIFYSFLKKAKGRN